MAAPDFSDPAVMAAAAAFAIADAERQAELAGRAYELADSRAVADRFGVEPTKLALRVRGHMLQAEAAAMEAYSVTSRLRIVDGGAQ